MRMEVNGLFTLLFMLSTSIYSAGANGKTFCYYSSFAQGRHGIGKFLPEHIDPYLCTHVIFAFGNVIGGSDIGSSNWNDLPTASDNGLYTRTTALKEKNPNLKVLLALGGWAAGSEPFIPILQSEENMRTFARNAIAYLRKYNFDGLDIDWEFPGARGSPPEDKYRFTTFLKSLQESFTRESYQTGNDKLLLTVAAAGGTYFISKAYEENKIGNFVDFLLLMAYNYHGSWNEYTGHHSGLYPRSDETDGEREWNMAWTVDFWVNKAGVPKNKVIVGIPTYGMGFTLKDPSQHGLRAPASGGSSKGEFTGEAGIMSYYEICNNLENGYRAVWVEDQKVPYAYKGNQWVGYENRDSVAYKANYINDLGLGGAFIWSVEMDDFRGSCGQGNYPLLSTIVRILRGSDNEYGGQAKNNYIEAKKAPSHGSNMDYSDMGQNIKSPESIYSKQHVYTRRPPAWQPEKPTAVTKYISRENNEYSGNRKASSSTSRERLNGRHVSYENSQSKYKSYEDGVYNNNDISNYNSYENVRTYNSNRNNRSFNNNRSRSYNNINNGHNGKRIVTSRRLQTRRPLRRSRNKKRSFINKYRPTTKPANQYARQSTVYRQPPKKIYRSSINSGTVDFTHSPSNMRHVGSKTQQLDYYDYENSYMNKIIPNEQYTRPLPALNTPRHKNNIDGYSKTKDFVYGIENPGPVKPIDYSYSDVGDTNLYNSDTDVEDTTYDAQDATNYNYYEDTTQSTGLESAVTKVPITKNWKYEQGFECTKTGLFSDPAACSSYYICVQHGDRWYNFRLRCPDGLAFKADIAACGYDTTCKTT